MNLRVMLSKKKQTQKEDILYDSNYMKSNYRQTEL